MVDIATIQPRQGKLEIEGKITEVGEPRAFNKFGKEGKVADARIKDASGEIKLTLWNEQVDQVKVGDTVKISNGWSDEYRGEMQVSTGRFGSLAVVSSGAAPAPAPADPKKPDGKSSSDVDEEELLY